MSRLEDADPLDLHRAAAVTIELLQNALPIRNPIPHIDLKLDRQNLAHIDLFLWHKQLEERQLITAVSAAVALAFTAVNLNGCVVSTCPPISALRAGMV